MRLPLRLLRVLLASLLVLAAGVAGAAPCPSTAGLTIVADNQSADASVSITVTGRLLDPDASCDGGDDTYAANMSCNGEGPVRCGRIDGLRPGAWIHEIRVQVAGSQPQVQSQRALILADSTTTVVSNVVPWTIYPRAFEVSQIDGTHLLAQLDAAQAWTASHPGQYALVTFDREIFPGAAQPRTINVKFTQGPPNACAPQQVCTDGRATTYCFAGSRVVVDALDVDAKRGGVILRTGTCERSLMRILGSDNVFRGLEFRGSEQPNSPIPIDTLAITSANAKRNRLEQCIVRGPTRGDAISLEESSGAPGGLASENVVVDTEVVGAEDKGIKITSQAHATILESCIHDNRNGGIQSTLGGHVTAVRNVVQRNAPGSAQNGLSVGVPENVISRSSMVTDGNIVRFAGARGISVVNTGDGFFNHDVVTDNQTAGTRIETTRVGVRPSATFRGVSLACNAKPVTGTCFGEPGKSCVRHTDCALQQCVGFTNASDGFGVVATIVVKAQPDVAECPNTASCLSPLVDFGPTGGDPGRNAFTLNENLGSGTPGVNFNNALPAPEVIFARGNQWERCGDELFCDVVEVALKDVRPVTDPPAVTVGTPTGPRGGPAPEVARVSLPRPRKGDLVRVYNGALDGIGGTFNAIAGASCVASGLNDGLPAGIPTDICSADNPNVVSQNRVLQRGNRVLLSIGGEQFDADVHGVTPTMLAFRMPVDCWAAGTITVARGQTAISQPVPFCDPGGCADRAADALCDDGSVCTADDRCDAAGACAPGVQRDCSGQCRTGACDPEDGCVLRPDTAACDDGNACTVDDHCAGSSDACEPGTPRVCAGACLTGACDADAGCLPRPQGTGCDDGNACTVEDQCSGVDGTCSGGSRSCDDGDPCTVDACDPVSGCSNVRAEDGTACGATDACTLPSSCQAGECAGGGPVPCGDADFCTVDSCSPTAGCQHVAATGTQRVSCRLDESRFILSTAPDGGGAAAAPLLKKMAKVDAALARVSAAKTDRVQRQAVRKVRGTLRGLVTQLRRSGKRLGPVLQRQLKRSADAAMDAVDGLRP